MPGVLPTSPPPSPHPSPAGEPASVASGVASNAEGSVHAGRAGVRRWPVVMGFGLWTLFVWANRLRNIWDDLLLSTDEKVWYSLIALSFLVLGVAVAVIGFGLRRYLPSRGDVITIGVLAGWTAGVWLARGFEIVTDDANSGAFIAVHLVVAVVSVAWGVAAWLALGPSAERRVAPPTGSPLPPAGSVPPAGDR